MEPMKSNQLKAGVKGSDSNKMDLVGPEGKMLHGQEVVNLTGTTQSSEIARLIKQTSQNTQHISLEDKQILTAFYIKSIGSEKHEINIRSLKILSIIFMKDGGQEILKKVLALDQPNSLLKALAANDPTSQPSLSPEILDMALKAGDSTLATLCSSPELFSLKPEIFERILKYPHPEKLLNCLSISLNEMGEFTQFWQDVSLEIGYKIIDFIAKDDVNAKITMGMLYSNPHLNRIPPDLWDHILVANDSPARLNCLSKHPQLYLEGSMPRELLNEVLKKGSIALIELLNYPQLWKSGPQCMPLEILSKIVKKEISARETANILKLLGENPYLWQEGPDCMPRSYLHQILDLDSFYTMHTRLKKCENPQLWQAEDGWRNHPLFNQNVDELISFIDKNSRASEIIRGLELLHVRLQPPGDVEQKQVFDKALIAHKAVKTIFEDDNGMNTRFGLKQEDVIAFISQSKNESLETILKAVDVNLRQFIKAFLSSIFMAQENEILQHINPDAFAKRDDLVQHLESLRPKSYVGEKLIIQAKVWSEMGKNKKLKHFPFSEIWRFVMDGSCEAKGAYFFEDEPGYIVAALNGLLMALQFKAPPSLNQYDELHDTIVTNVLSTKNRSDNDTLADFVRFDLGFAKQAFSYYITGQDSDTEGLDDLKARGSGMPFEYNAELKKVSGITIPGHPEALRLVEAKFTQMNEFIANKPPAMRLLAYIWLARELELMHILPDANGRSTMILLYQLVANDPDIPMIVFHNPNVLDVNGPEKLLCRMLENMEKFKHAGAWPHEGHQQSNASFSLAALPLHDPEIAQFRDRCLQEVNQMSWKEFHALIAP